MTALLLIGRVTLVVSLALVAAALVRHRSAATRHWILATGISLALFMPVLTGVLPTWRVWSPVAAVPASADAGTTIVLSGAPSTAPVSTPSPAPFGPAALAAAVWIAGALAGVGILAIGLVRLARLTAGARPVGGEWERQVAEVGRMLDLDLPVRVLETDHPALLVTWGVRGATILLPAGAAHWPSRRIRLVVAHELAHIARRDWLVQIASELLRVVHWFNPIVWLACRRLRQESECACDDAVLRLNVPGTEYAEALVGLARDFGGHRAPRVPAPAIGRPSTLQRRIRAMLNVHLDRRPIPVRARLIATGALLLLALPIAAAGRQSAATFSGTVTDPSGRPVPGVVVALTSTAPDFKIQTQSDATGAFQLPVVTGTYDVEVALPGFEAATATVSIGPAESVRRDFNLQLGTLSESITVAQSTAPPRRTTAAAPAGAASGASAAGGTPAACPQTTVGGNIRVPRKIKDVRPIYPAGLDPAAGTKVVQIEASIAPDGTVGAAQVVGQSAPELDAAALTAVRQWLFTPTLLNCEPVEVSMQVTVTFDPRR